MWPLLTCMALCPLKCQEMQQVLLRFRIIPIISVSIQGKSVAADWPGLLGKRFRMRAALISALTDLVKWDGSSRLETAGMDESGASQQV